MNRQTTAARPNSLGRIRSLLAFRHRNPAARLVSTLLAFAIAMLLVAGTAPAYADDSVTPDATVSADDTGTATEEPAPATEEPAPATEEPAPATEEPAPATEEPAAPTEESAPATEGKNAPADEGTDAPGSGPVVTALKTLAAGDPAPAVVGNVTCQDTPNTMVGGFEIDGDPCDDEGGIDFLGGPGGSVDDGFGDSGNWFTQGSSENDDPSTWTMTGASNTGKADIGTAWAWSHTYHSGDIDPNTPGDQLAADDGHVFAYFGFTNDSTSGGTQDYSLEYNQADPVGGKPVRTVGDLLFHFFSNGSNELEYKASYIYTDASDASWDKTCVASGNLGAGWCPFTLPANAYTTASSATGEYVEGAIDITILFGEGNCSPTFGTTFLRSAPGAFFTSELKDYVAPIGVTTPSTCGSLVITKTDADTDALVAGAVFAITGDPRPGGDPTDTYCVFDGVDADKPAQPAECDIYEADGLADGTVTIDLVEPGDYTVEEIVAPPGYLLNGDATDSWSGTVEDGEEQLVQFANHRIWQGLDVTKSATGHFGAHYFWDIEKQIAPASDGPWSDGTTVGDPLVKNVEAGDDTSLYYQLVVTEDHVDTSGYVVDGTIHVANPNPDTFPNDGAVHATIGESLSGCTLDSNDAAFPITVDVPSGGADYAYTCDLGDGPESAGTNTATVTWDKSDYPHETADLTADDNDPFTDSGQDGYTFDDESSIDKTITVTDDHFVFAPAWEITWGDDADGTYESGVYSFDTEAVPGTCSAVITNTATIHGDNDANLGDTSENGKVCVEDNLAADVSSEETLTRTFNWDVDKSTTTPPPATISVVNGQATAHYNVTITALPSEDSGWEMHGTVSITNPNDFTAKQVSSIDVAYSGGGSCSLDDPLPNVAANGSADVDFHCDFAGKPDYDGEVTATVNWDADVESASDPTPAQVTEADWMSTATLVDQFIKVFDDHAVPGDEDPLFEGNQLKWQDVFDSIDPAAHQVEVEYDHTYSGAILPATGTCKNLTNTAWFTGDDAELTLGSDDATVRVCTAAILPPVIVPPVVNPPHSLPNTGGPNLWVLAAGMALLLGGSSMVAADRRRRRRS